MSHAGFKRGDTGIHTVEGNIAGAKAARYAKKREKDQQEYEAKKRKIQDESQRSVGTMDQKFKSIQQNAFQLDFVGLKTKEEFQSLKDAAEEEYLRQHQKDDEEAARRKKEKEEKKKKKLKESKVSRLSFAIGGDDEEEDNDDAKEESGHEEKGEGNKKEENGTGSGSSSLFRKKKKALRNPEAETSFLPDPEQAREEQELREKLKQEWLEEQERLKNDMLEVTYSYWDGSGHRRVLTCKKGTTIAKFLELVKAQVAKEFTELRSISPDDLMYVKEDLIIPHNYSFYDLIVTKARGKSGPLFHFDVHDDVRMTIDTRVEKDESHPGKVVDRKWYERNKHIFPASRWEVYDPKVERGGYSIHGQEVNAKKK